jgi:hypothetical protein
MMRYRTSIAGLMLFTLLIGMGTASLLNASRLWASLIPTLTTMLLLAAILGVTYRTGENRAPWVGFTIFGWGYVLLSVSGGLFKEVLIDPSQESRRVLLWLDLKKNLTPVTGEYSDVMDYTRGGRFARAKVLDSYGPGNYTVQFEDGQKVGANIRSFRRDNTEFYLIVGNSLCNLLFAFAGFLFARYFYSTRMEHIVTPT